jgi:hypothetical protein
MAIDAETFAKWQEWSRRDDVWKLFVPSDIRVMLAEIERLRAALKPFAETAKNIPFGWEDGHSLGEWALCLDVADLRAAAACFPTD